MTTVNTPTAAYEAWQPAKGSQLKKLVTAWDVVHRRKTAKETELRRTREELAALPAPSPALDHVVLAQQTAALTRKITQLEKDIAYYKDRDREAKNRAFAEKKREEALQHSAAMPGTLNTYTPRPEEEEQPEGDRNYLGVYQAS